MESDKILKILKEVRKIVPNSDFTKKSRFLVLSSQPDEISSENPALVPTTSFGNFALIFKASSFSLAGVLLLVFIYYIGMQISPLFLPGLNYKNIIAEADSVNSQINIQLSQLRYFKEASNEGQNVLKEVSLNSPNYLSRPVISKEAQSINQSVLDPSYNNQVSQETNNILNQLSQ